MGSTPQKTSTTGRLMAGALLIIGIVSLVYLKGQLSDQRRRQIMEDARPQIEAEVKQQIVEETRAVIREEARDKQHDDRREDEIRQVLDAQVGAWNKGDLPGFMAGYGKSPE